MARMTGEAGRDSLRPDMACVDPSSIAYLEGISKKADFLVAFLCLIFRLAHHLLNYLKLGYY